MLIFGTLGPAGSNHDWVTRRYLAFHGLDDARVALFPDFDDAIDSMLRGDVRHVVQLAVHPSVTDTVARYRGRAHIVDTFISPSQPMSVLTRTEVEDPKSLGLQMATREYVDTTRWETMVAETSTVSVAQGLLDGRYDSGLTRPGSRRSTQAGYVWRRPSARSSTPGSSTARNRPAKAIYLRGATARRQGCIVAAAGVMYSPFVPWLARRPDGA